MRHLQLAVYAALALTPCVASPGAAQAWNSDAALALARRGVDRRSSVASDTALRDYKAQAHGFLFFLGQFGAGLTVPPRLIKADQLELEVYWKAPGLSKQRIVGWRDRAELPTDISYHRDHLGIVQNNFGAAIRLGDGDEVRDVPHPLGPAGSALYDYALGDTTTITLPQRVVRVVALQVRPKRGDQPGVVGTLYMDVATADLVRLAFSFTARAYRDPQLEDVSVVLDNALWDGRFWLPYRQEIEIRRRATWLDIPARGIIRARWNVDGYQFNLGLVRGWFLGEEISALPKAERDSFPWPQPLAVAIQGMADPVRQDDLAAVRAEIERVAGRQVLSGLKARLLGARSVSELAHWNRVEGLTLGAGMVWRGGAGGEARELRALGGYGFAGGRATGNVTALARQGQGTFQAEAYRAVRDVGDVPVIAPLLNSLGGQELGDDFGDYYLATGARISYRRTLGSRVQWSSAAGREAIGSLGVRAASASGPARPNPALGGPGVDFVAFAVERESQGLAVRRDLHFHLTLEGGRLDGRSSYVRAAGVWQVLFPVGATRGLVRVQGGAASDHLPVYRAFVLGGRGTLLGDDFRAWGGRRMALAHVEWRVPVPFLSLAVGPYTRTPRSLIVAPYAAAGWSDRPVAGTPWRATPGVRATIGLGVEWLGVFRLEAGFGAQSRQVGFAFDVTRDFWDIL
jgi:hypothetical protein